MKVERGSFTVNSSNVGILLNDDTINVTDIWFQVVHASSGTSGASSGFSDGTDEEAQSVLAYDSTSVTNSSSSYAITHYKRVSGSNVLKLAGNVTDLSTPGEIYMSFSTYDPSLTVKFLAKGT